MEPFFLDSQTKEDLQIFGVGGKSLFSCLNCTITKGGDWKLKDLLTKPLTDRCSINERSVIIKFLMENVEQLAFDKTTVDFMDYYLRRPDKPIVFTVYKACSASLKNFLFPSSEYYIKRRGVHETLETLAFLQKSVDLLSGKNSIPFIENLNILLKKFRNYPVFSSLIRGEFRSLSRFEVEKADFLFRKKLHKETLEILDEIYLLDAYYSVASSSMKMGFKFPSIVEGQAEITIENLFHPYLEKPVSNSINLSETNNVCFITGANMSGKSTLMKSIGIAVYLAHLGFPVPASRMNICILDGLITTINLADNINLGYSHFYNEVKRVKMVGEKLKENKRMLVIFDEFFRGTNVKDAHDASLRITQAFTTLKQSFFIVSTHIVEVADALKTNKGILFRYFQTDMESGKPVFNYRLKEGVTDDRIGLWILESEGVFKLLENREA